MPTRKEGLTVTVQPSASAYFAGEQFTATITFTNSHPPLRVSPPPPPPQLSHSRTASSINLNSWNTSAGSRNKPPNASHLGLAEYATNNLHSDQVPPSPYFGSTSGQFQPFPSTSSSNSRNATPPSISNSPKRPNFTSSLSNPHNPAPLDRSISGSSQIASPSNVVPSRKGLIGKAPIREVPESSFPPSRVLGEERILLEEPYLATRSRDSEVLSLA